jgi:UDP-glucose 4-epimerase
MQRRVPDCGFARSLTGFQPAHTLDDIIRDVIQDQAAQPHAAAVSAS